MEVGVEAGEESDAVWLGVAVAAAWCEFEASNVCAAMAKMKTVAPVPAKTAIKRRFLLLRGGGPAPAGALAPGRTPDTAAESAAVSSRAE